MCVASLLSACNTKRLCIESDFNLRSRLSDEDGNIIVDEVKEEPMEDVEMVECLEVTDDADFDSKIEYLEDEDINPAELITPDLDLDQPKISFKCYICNMHFGYERKRADHLKTNHFDRDLVCGDCNYRARTPQALNSHLELHVRPELLTNDNETFNPSDKVTQTQLKAGSSKIVFTQKCHVCQETFCLKAQKKEHLYRMHADLNLNCELCPKKCKTILGMDEHLRVHQNPELLAHMCHMCSKFFIRAWELRAHIKYDHRISKVNFENI
jgi:Zinc finger, C2H2 type